MAWTLLVMLALYDLFAVLSPCGPLKALAKMISKPGAPALPGLLYEASLPEGVQKPKSKTNDKSRSNDNESSDTDTNSRSNDNRDTEEEKQPEDGESQQICSRHNNIDQTSRTMSVVSRFECSGRFESQQENGSSRTMRRSQLDSNHGRQTERNTNHPSNSSSREIECSQPTERSATSQTTVHQRSRHNANLNDQDLAEIPNSIDISNTGQVPLALAKMYKLNVLDTAGVLKTRRFASQWKRYYSPDEIQEGNWTGKQLRSDVTAIFPPRGGNILTADEQKYDAGTAYVVYNRSGEEVRKFVVTPEGKVFQVLRRDPNTDGGDREGDDGQNNSIKLGIGDFVFYSVLVSKAAQFSYTTFITCFFVVLSGLAATLVILALKGRALPALPISIFLGVICFLWTKELVQPWIQDFLRLNIYV
jgi:hypothetical protein